MSKAVPFIIGGLEIAGGIALEVVSAGANPYGYQLIAAGIGSVIAGIGSLLATGPGFSTAARNPIMPWNVIYGRAKTGGAIVYINSFGDNDKYLDIVFVLACHACEGVDTLLFDNQRVLIDPITNCSYSPTQRTVNITTITRTQGVVRVTLSASIPDLEDGDQILIQNVSGVDPNDRDLNGRYFVAVIDALNFTYMSGGLDVALAYTGQAVTLWPDYQSKVYMEALLGNQTSTFSGMLNGTPYDGDLGDLQTLDNNPWTAQHLLNGRTCVMLRLHYNDQVFASGLPQIAFRVRGKNDIFDPRIVAPRGFIPPMTPPLLNGWGPNGHVGPYEMGVDQGFGWGTDGGTTNPYGSVEQATDSNMSSYCVQSYRHTHQYAGCVWQFPSILHPTFPLYLSILSAVPSSGPGSARSAGIYYSLDSGATWHKIYDQAVRPQQWDNVTLATGFDTSQVQVMAFMDSHDDMTHQIYEMGIGPVPFSGTGGGPNIYTENSALCIADYLANTTFGFKAAYKTEIPLDPLIAAANLCDEPVDLTGGGSEPRYTCNGQFQLSTRRGEVLQNLLTSCGGRITYSGGQFIIHPATWEGTSLTINTTPGVPLGWV